MFALFEEAGKFQAGRVLSEADASSQVELDSGKRVKVKAANVLLKFDKPAPAELIRQAQALAQGIELELAWEFAPEDEFGFADLARDYFSEKATLEQQAAALFRLFEAPHYFRRAGKGRFKKAPAEILQQALVAIEKKKALQQQISEWAAELAAGTSPQPIRDQLFKILFKPDKNAPEYKAVVEASRATHLAPLDLLQRAGAIASPYQFHWKRFLFDNFPKGTAFPPLPPPPIADDLPLGSVQAFSIDDSQTTEIDDALSVQGLGSGTITVGIHIAAPGLALQPGAPIDLVARQRLSTVYMPGYKITMLPDDVVQAYTLMEGRDCPAISLYASFDEATLELKSSETKIERVPIVANLRHDQLDTVVTAQWLEDPAFEHQGDPEPASRLREPLTFLYRLARHLKAQREIVRGKPENFNRPDYNFKLVGNDGAEPTGDEEVRITIRQRGSPLDLMVAEAMILANSTWGSWLSELGVPGIYRSQASMAPGVKVRMGTKALPHAGIGVKSYAWSTSPLRRYTDLVNQWQILACATNGVTAPLVAPFKPRDANLFAIVSAFDAAYAAYNDHQQNMERYWCLRWLGQEEARQVEAVVLKDEVLRLVEIPLIIRLPGMPQVARGAQVKLDILRWDEVDLSIEARLLEMPAAAEISPDAELDYDEDEDSGQAAAAEAVEAEGAVAVVTPEPEPT